MSACPQCGDPMRRNEPPSPCALCYKVWECICHWYSCDGCDADRALVEADPDFAATLGIVESP